MPLTITTLLSALICITLAPLIASAAPEKGTAAAGDKMVERGKQLVTEGNCDYCHTPLIETKEGPVPDIKRRLSGHPQDREIPRLPDTEVGSTEWIEFLGTLDTTEWAGPWGLVFSKNITPDPETGIGKWTEEIFIGTMRSGKHIDLKRDIMPPMPWQDYARLPDYDLKSVFAYLMTLPPVKNAVPKPVPMPGKKSGE
ncbi:MAG: diheme cytochrome c-553 [Thermodesulfobacteriota bacterium]